jgi:hypothetical protein
LPVSLHIDGQECPSYEVVLGQVLAPGTERGPPSPPRAGRPVRHVGEQLLVRELDRVRVEIGRKFREEQLQELRLPT